MFERGPERHPVRTDEIRTIWIVDGAYLFNHGRNKPFDYLKLKAEIERANGGRIHEAYYLNTAPDVATDSQNAFHSWLKSAPPRGPKMRVQLYSLKELNCTCPGCGNGFTRSVQKGVDVGIATLIVKLAAQNCYDRLILSAGDGDFADAITYIKSDLHKQFWLHGAMANLSTDLQCYADEVLWIDDMHPAIDKDKPSGDGRDAFRSGGNGGTGGTGGTGGNGGGDGYRPDAARG